MEIAYKKCIDERENSYRPLVSRGVRRALAGAPVQIPCRQAERWFAAHRAFPTPRGGGDNRVNIRVARCTSFRVVNHRFESDAKHLYLGALGKLGDQFGRVRLSLGRAALKPSDAYWGRYLATARALGQEGAEAALNLNPKTAKRFRKALKNHPSEMLPVGEAWQGWAAGLASTGLSSLIDKAQSAEIPH